jgi:hypothetical protein
VDERFVSAISLTPCHPSVPHLQTYTRNITLSLSSSTESGDQDLVVLVDKVQTTVIGDESGDLLSVLDELDSDTLSDGGVGLLGLNTDLYGTGKDESVCVGLLVLSARSVGYRQASGAEGVPEDVSSGFLTPGYNGCPAYRRCAVNPSQCRIEACGHRPSCGILSEPVCANPFVVCGSSLPVPSQCTTLRSSPLLVPVSHDRPLFPLSCLSLPILLAGRPQRPRIHIAH